MPVDAQRAQAILLAALEAPEGAERAAVLDRECAADVELRKHVQELLEAHANPASILDQPAAAPFLAATQSAVDPQGPTEAAREGGHEPISLPFLAPPTQAGSLGRLGHYEVHEVLGQGGFGIVLRAFDEKLQRFVAIKVMAPVIAATSPARKRFLREARSAAAVRHENVVRIYAVEEQPLPFLVMEHIPGRTLQQKLDDEGPLETGELLRLAVQIARGLAAAHAQGLIHRDIKPSNILLENGVERVKISDFGLARAVDDASISQSGIIAGTPMYMSPEQAEGKPLDHRSDLFSLGSTLYALCTGHAPFRASSTLAVLKRVVEDEPRPIRAVNPAIPDWLAAIVAKLLAKRPEERFASAKEVADLLQAHLAHEQRPGLAPRPGLVTASETATPALDWFERSNLVTWCLVIAFGLLLPALYQMAKEVGGEAVGLLGAGSRLLLWPLLGLALLAVLTWGFLRWREKRSSRSSRQGWPRWSRMASQLAAMALVLGGFIALMAGLAGDEPSPALLLGAVAAAVAAVGVAVWGERRLPAASPPTAPQRGWTRWASYAAVAIGSLFILFQCERVGFTNFGRLLWFAHHEATLVLPDLETVVEVWATNDETAKGNSYSISARGGFEPRAVVANQVERRIRLAPGNYWLFAKRGGVELSRQLIKVGWGGSRTVLIADEPAAKADLARLQGDWEGVAVRYLGGPAFGAEALPLTGLQVKGKRLRLLLPGMDASVDFAPVCVGAARWLKLNSISSSSSFRIESRMDYAFDGAGLKLLVQAEQPAWTQPNPWGIPVLAAKQRGLEIVLRRKGGGAPAGPMPKLEPREQDQLIALARQAFEQAEQEFKSGKTQKDPLLAAERVLAERLAEAAERQDPAAALPHRRRLVAIAEEVLALMQTRVDSGLLPASALAPAEEALILAKARLRQAQESAAAAVSAAPVKLTDFETKLLAAINRERAKAKAPPLSVEPRLVRAARAHADDMARWGQLDHVREGRDLPARLKEAGYAHAACGENLAWNQSDPEQTLRAWLDAAGHRENVLNPRFSEMGLGTGRDEKGQAWHAVILAAPAAARGAPAGSGPAQEAKP